MTRRSRRPEPARGAEAGVEVAGALAPVPTLGATPVERPDDRPAVGSWWWVTSRGRGRKDEDFDRPGRRWLACVVEVGSNYAKLEGVRLNQRISLDEFHERCVPEPDPGSFIRAKIEGHRRGVQLLMEEARRICHRLGVPWRAALVDAQAASAQALSVAHHVDDVRAYGEALVRAKETELPELFERIAKEHKAMATWMQAELIPAHAELAQAREVTATIEGKIHVVELYAGLGEQLVQVRGGDPAAVDERVRLMQRRHYMDEECLARYEAGGMDFEDVGAFDEWLARDGNFSRILPHPRSVVAFRVRRTDKDYGDLNAFIKLAFDRENKRTFLYVRNGEQLWRLETSIDFGAELFPAARTETWLGDHELWVKSDEFDIQRGDGLITGRRRANLVQQHQERRDEAARQLRRWRRAGKPTGSWTYVAEHGRDHSYGMMVEPGETVAASGRPHRGWDLDRSPVDGFRLLTPDDIYYDDAMRRVQKVTLEHNRVAVVVQGLLDRSTCLHPHPPWRIWTPEGFASGVELVYDVSRAVTPGDAPDWAAYRQRLNEGLRPGCHAIGQREAWLAHMEETHGSRWREHQWRDRGPQRIQRVESMRRSGACEFRWTRERARPVWVPADRPGYRRMDFPPIPVRWWCPGEALTCVDAYTPGDYRMFYDDPRTRADYLRWAPVLLACEDWHHRRKTSDGEETPP